MFKMLKRAGIEHTEKRLHFKQYQKETVVIRFGEFEEETCIRKGVKQDCTLSPKFTHLGVKLNSRKINVLRFTDDIAVIAENEKE